MSAQQEGLSTNSLLATVFPGGAGALVSFGGLEGWSGSGPPGLRSTTFEATGLLPRVLLWVSSKALFVAWLLLWAGRVGLLLPQQGFCHGSPLASFPFSSWYSWMAFLIQS